MNLRLAIEWQLIYSDTLRAIVLYYTFISFVGIVVNLWAAYDSRRDLILLHRAKINSLIERTGKISYRDAVSILFMHVIFFTLGIINLGYSGNAPTSDNQAASILIYTFVVSVVQSVIVATQCWNQLDRISIRNELIKGSDSSDSKGPVTDA